MRELITSFKVAIVSESDTLPSFILARTKDIKAVDDVGTLAESAERTRSMAACPFSPDEDAVINATGLLTSSPEPTVQSSAFFNDPGIPKAYSGVQIKTPSAFSSCLRKLFTSSGATSGSLKCGRYPRPSYHENSTCSGSSLI